MNNLLHSEILPVELSNRNDGQTKHWTSAQLQRKRFDRLMVAYRRQPFVERVDVVIVRILGHREKLWDADSILRGNAKQLLDSLVAAGWFKDDGPKYIRHVLGMQDGSRRTDKPATEVQVWREGTISVN